MATEMATVTMVPPIPQQSDSGHAEQVVNSIQTQAGDLA